MSPADRRRSLARLHSLLESRERLQRAQTIGVAIRIERLRLAGSTAIAGAPEAAARALDEQTVAVKGAVAARLEELRAELDGARDRLSFARRGRRAAAALEERLAGRCRRLAAESERAEIEDAITRSWSRNGSGTRRSE